MRKSGKNEEDVFSYRVCVFHQGVYLGESTSLPADLRVWNKQWFLLNWGEIWGLKGSQDGTWTPFFLLQNRFGCRGSFDVCFGSASPTLEYVLGRPMVTCLQAESQSPGSWPSLMKYFRESLTLLMPMCASSLLLYPLVLSHLSLPQTLPAHPHTSLPHLHYHVPRILFEKFITRTLSLCSPDQMSTAWQTDRSISCILQNSFDGLLPQHSVLCSQRQVFSCYRSQFC